MKRSHVFVISLKAFFVLTLIAGFKAILTQPSPKQGPALRLPMGVLALLLIGATWLAAPGLVYAQGPGGVTNNLHAWFKADTGAFTDAACTPGNEAADGNAVACWQDQSGNGYNATHATGGQQPIYRTNRLNTHPTFEFDGSNDRLATLNLQLFATSSSGLTVFTVFDTDDNASQRFVIAKGVSNVCADEFELGYDTGLTAGSGNFGLHRGCSRAIVAPKNTIANNTFYVMSTHVLTTGTTPNNQNIYQNQTSLSLVNDNGGWLSAGAYDTSLEPLNVGTRRDNGSYGAYHDGDIVEIVIYTDELDPAERGRVASYLALKYGVTLDSSVDYLASASTIVYPSTGSHSGYVNDIAGIGLDSASTLTQTTSRSINPDSIVTITGTLASMSDGEFLVWGNDDGALTPSAEVPSSVSQRLTREWRAAETGEVGTVTISFDLTGLTVFSNATDFALLIDSDGDFSDAAAITGATVNGRVVTFSGVSFSNGDYFSLAPLPADLVITKIVDPTTAQPGETITYTLTFSNAGGTAAAGVVITDAIPVSVTNVSVISSGVSITDTGASPAYVWQVQDLDPGEAGVITITAEISSPLAAGVFTNTATITTTSVDGDTTNNTDSAEVTVMLMLPATQPLYLPLIFKNWGITPLTDLIPAIKLRPVSQRGETFYSEPLKLTATTLPDGGSFYFSAAPDSLEPAWVDDQLALVKNQTDIFTYDFSDAASTAGLPSDVGALDIIPSLVEVPRAFVQEILDGGVTVEFRDVYGGYLGSSNVWLIWVP